MSEVWCPDWKTHWGSFSLSRITSLRGAAPPFQPWDISTWHLQILWYSGSWLWLLFSFWRRTDLDSGFNPCLSWFLPRYGFTSGDLPFPSFISASFYLASLHPLPSETQVIGSLLLGLLLFTSDTYEIEVSVWLWYLQSLKLTSWVLSVVPMLPIDLKYP